MHIAEKYNTFTDIDGRSALQMDEAEKARRVDTLPYQIKELERAKLRPGEEEELSAAQPAAQRGKIHLRRPGRTMPSTATTAAVGRTTLRQAQDALGAVRHLDDASPSCMSGMDALYSEVYDVAYGVEDKRVSLTFAPVSWTGGEPYGSAVSPEEEVRR